MSTQDHTDATEDAAGKPNLPAETEPPDPATEAPLAATVVRYAGEPDRVTVYPPGASSVARMSTWLTADIDAFVDLEDCR
jgi:hypothetical protein